MNAFECSLCNKSFKTQPALKAHNTKTHKPTQSVVVEQQQIFEEQIDTSSNRVICDSPVFISEQKMESAIHHCPGCNCFKKQDVLVTPKNVEIGTTDLYNAQDITSYNARNAVFRFAEELPKIIQDLQFTIDRQLIAIDEHFQVLNLSKLPIFNQYEQQIVDPRNRVTKGLPQIVNKCSLRDYKFDSKKGNRHKLSLVSNDGIGVISKLLCENDIQFKYPKIEGIYWDIETFNMKSDFNIPQADDFETTISMLVALKNTLAKIWILERFSYKVNQIQSVIQTKTDIQLSYEIIVCEDDVDIARSFVQYLQQLNTFHYLCGFNATQSKQKGQSYHPHCYDMQVIMRKAGLNPNHFQVRSQRWFNQKELAYVSYKNIPFVQFIDFKQLAQPHVQMFEGRIEGYKLNHILEFMGVPNKIDADYNDLMKTSRCANSDMSYYIAYCIYDCLSLQIADQKHRLFEQQFTFCQMLNVPISAISHMSTAQNLQIYGVKLFVQAGYSVHYSYLKYQETRPKHGAETRQVQKDDQFTYISNVIACDYTSEYPNAIVQKNIGIDTLTNIETSNAVDINYLRGDPMVIYFKDNEESITCKFIKQLLENKAYYKKIGDICKEKSTKLAANSFYGLHNQDINPLYNYECASAITGFGRFMLTFAEQKYLNSGYKILSMDTDGLEITPVNPTRNIEEIAQEINNEYPRFVLELETGNEAIFNSKKKAYLKRKWNTPFKLSDLSSLKGFGSKTKLQPYMRGKIIQFCNTILDAKPTTLTQIVDLIGQFKTMIFEEINKCIELGKDLTDYTMFQKHTKSLTKDGQLTKSGKLEHRFGLKSVYQIVPYNFNESRKDFNFAQYSTSLDVSRIQINDMVDALCQPITQFFEVKSITKQLKDELKDGQIMLRIEPGNRMQICDIEDVKDMVIASKNKQVYHEKILSDTCKLYFDVETKRKQHEDGTWSNLHFINMEKFKDILFSQLTQTYTIHIADGCTKIDKYHPENDKQSYHVVVDVIMAKSQMQSLANRINKLYDGTICDLQVYSDDASLRLPLQHKLGKSTVMKIITNSTFDDFIVQNTKSTYPNLQNPIAFTQKSHFGLVKHGKANTNALKYIEQRFGLKCELFSSYILCPVKKPFKCPLSGVLHTSQNLKVKENKITCFSDKCKDCEPIIIPEDLRVIESVWEQKILPGAHKVNMREITYNIDSHRFTFVKSQKGTGKTKHLVKELAKPQYKDMYMIAVSFRRTFATDFAIKMGFQNYQELRKQICLHDNPRVIVQIDSLHRICLDNINPNKIVFIIDEIESVLDQSDAFSEKPLVQRSFDVLKDILRACNKVICLDADMTERSVWLLNKLADNNNYQVIHNTFMPQRGQLATIYLDKATDKFKADYQQNIMNRLLKGQNVVSFCSTSELARGMCKIAEQQGISYKLYHGKDEIFENCHSGKNMYDAKNEDFRSVQNAFKTQLLIYTSTLTAGISYEEQHFHSSVNYFAYNTCSSIAAVQAMQRVRNIEDKELTLYIEVPQKSSIQQTAYSIAQSRIQIYNQFQVYSPIRELTMYLDARMNEQHAHKNEIILDAIQDQGYTLQIIKDHDYTGKLNTVKTEIDYNLQLAETDLDILKQIKFKDYLRGNQDQTLPSKIHLVCLYKTYKHDFQSLQQFNDLSEKEKKSLQANKEKQIEKLAWQKIAKLTDKELTLENAVQIAREYEKKLDIEQRFLNDVDQSLTLKKRDTFVQRIEYIQHCEVLKTLDQEQKQEYIKTKSSQFVKVFNQIMLPIFNYQIKVKRVQIGGQRTQQYELIQPE